ncbi:MAG: hypothetical protein C4519_16280 [Desulfobacteraceae bacterium]|nr:MAG: hypothetical protein C4519_16280 [Desulfobacteraceae bacterium]
MKDEFFKGVKQWEFNLRGMQGMLPTFYYDTTSLTAVYTASTRQVKQRLPLALMNPIELLPGRCLVAFTAFEYRRTDIDPYNEFSIAFLTTFRRRQIPLVTAAVQLLARKLSAFVWKLPVTTEIARTGGVEMFGYPKFIADIDFHREEDQIICRLAEKQQAILTLKGKILPTKRRKISRVQTYSVIGDIPLVANVVFNPLEMAVSSSRRAATLEIGSVHPIASELRALGLSKSPFQYLYSPVSQAILFAGRNLMDN